MGLNNEFSAEECEAFEKTVVEDVQLFSTVEISASIIGVQSISNFQPCLKCRKKTVPKHGSKTLHCESCHMIQKVTPQSKH